MTSDDLAQQLATKTRLTPEQARSVVDAFAQTLVECFTKKEKVVIGEFGSFFVADDGTIQFSPSAKLKA